MVRTATKRRSDGATKGFTLTEMMVAVAILVVIIIAISRIFSTASKVTAIGTAASDVLQEAVAIEQQMRNDFRRITPDGFLAIRCIAVPNSLNALAGGGLLNPAMDPNAWIRADQILFFANGAESIQGYRQGAGANRRVQGTVSRIYYGHGFQVPQAPGVETASGGGFSTGVLAIDPQRLTGNPMVPWTVGQRSFVRTRFEQTVTGNDYTTINFGSLDATQPAARQWNLARQSVVLADDGDGGDPVVHLFTIGEGGSRTARTIDDAVIVNGRVDAAATQLNDIRSFILLATQGNSVVLRPWLDFGFSDSNGDGDQRSIMVGPPGQPGGLLFYPRAERSAPSMHRVDQALTNTVIGTGCSSLAIDWTYEDGTGRIFNAAGAVIEPGIVLDPARMQPWFGIDPNNERGVTPLRDWMQGSFGTTDGDPIFVQNIEGPAGTVVPPILVYEATFGFNRETALNAAGNPLDSLGYTPWPSALRITMTLHDPDVRLEAGRQVQFVIDLPDRVKARPQ